jgi:hypothetical protein
VEAPASWQLTIGHTLPADTPIQAVTLDGAPVDYELVNTIRGREVRIETSTAAPHTLTVMTAESDKLLTLEPERARVLVQ